LQQKIIFVDIVYTLVYCRLESLEQFVWFDDDQLASSLMETTVQSAPHQVIDKQIDRPLEKENNVNPIKET
jgi:hypothetical protein